MTDPNYRAVGPECCGNCIYWDRLGRGRILDLCSHPLRAIPESGEHRCHCNQCYLNFASPAPYATICPKCQVPASPFCKCDLYEAVGKDSDEVPQEANSD